MLCRMKIGVIGLGDIARKAYLPVLAARPGVEPHLCTRTRSVLDAVGDAHRVPSSARHTGLDGLLAAGLDAAFVHAPTDVHVEIAGRLIDAGIPTYVDKPLAYDLAGAEHLVRLAERRRVSLMTGFNRRYAPAYAQCLEHPRDVIILQKHRTGLPAAPREFVYDDFIHVVDTLRFLLPGPAQHTVVRARVRDGLMHHVYLEMSGEDFTAVGVMNRMSGSSEELLDVMGEDTKRQVLNLAEVVDHRGQPTVRRRGDWVPVARQRGFEQIVGVFLDAVEKGTLLDATDALRTHELCERIVTEVEERHGPRPAAGDVRGGRAT
jgi:virulence factor